MNRRAILIVGGGYSGALVATHLLRSDAAPLRILLADRSGSFARGVAYGTTSPGHLLNVPAGRMSALPDDDEHFLRYARSALPSASGGDFLPRRLYGEYIEATLAGAERQGEGHGHSLERLVEDVVALDPDSGGGVTAYLASGDTIAVAHAILALGNFSPSDPVPMDGDRSFFESPRYVRDPWRRHALDDVDTSGGILLIGTGLTMLDIAMLIAERPGVAPIFAFSRRGLLPLPHRPHGAPPSYGHLPPGLIACQPTAAAYLRAIREHARELARDGIDWREVMGSLRPLTPRLWQTLDTAERRRFLRHLRPYWDTHRHRVAAELHDRFEQLQRRQRLSLIAGRVRSLRAREQEAIVTYRPRGEGEDRTLHVSTVINCTGPESDLRRVRDPLIASLLDGALARTDALGLGLDTDERQALLRADGRPHDRLWLTGPLLKGKFWESTAVPELRVHAAHVVRSVLNSSA